MEAYITKNLPNSNLSGKQEEERLWQRGVAEKEAVW